jgi:hypothetical protein
MKWTSGIAIGIFIVLLMAFIAYMLTHPRQLIAVPPTSRTAGTTLYTQDVQQLPSPSPAGAVQALEDISLYDLRAWHRPDANATGRNGQPVGYVNVLRMKKRSDVSVAVAHYATSGTVIDLSCLTLECTAQRVLKGVHNPNWTEYAVTADIHALPPESEFLWVVQGTYWDGFRSDTMESAETYVDYDGDPHTKLRLVVLFPPNKRATIVAAKRIDDKTDVRSNLPIPPAMTGPQTEVNWEIPNPVLGSHYALEWRW